MLRQTSSYMVAHGVSALFGFSAIVVFTRLLSPEEYGVYVVGMSLAGIVNAMLFSWVRLSILRYQSEGETADIRLTALVGYGLSAALSPLLILVFFIATDSALHQIVLATLVALALGLFEFGQEILKASQRPVAYMRAAIVRAVSTLAISLLLVQLGLGGLALLLGISAAYILTGLLFAPGIWRGPVKGFDREVFLAMLAFGAPMALSGTVFALHAALDRLIVVHLLGEAAAGIYGASADLVRQIILFPAIAVGSAMVPVVIRSLAEGGRDKADVQLENSAELLLAVVLPAVLGLAIVSADFSALMLGAEFRDTAALLIPILAFAWLFQAITHQFVQVSFHLAKTPRLLLVQGCAILVVNVAATLMLVPSFGLAGAAWALVVAEGAGVVVGYWLAGRAYRLPLAAKRLFRVVLAGALMALPTAGVASLDTGGPAVGLALSVVVGIVSYGAAVLVLDVVGLRTLVAQKLRPFRAGA